MQIRYTHRVRTEQAHAMRPRNFNEPVLSRESHRARFTVAVGENGCDSNPGFGAITHRLFDPGIPEQDIGMLRCRGEVGNVTDCRNTLDLVADRTDHVNVAGKPGTAQKPQHPARRRRGIAGQPDQRDRSRREDRLFQLLLDLHASMPPGQIP